MTTNIPRQQRAQQSQPIDSAALAASATAATLSILIAQGPFHPLNAAVGVTLTTLLLAYELKRCREGFQNLAFGMVCALCTLLVVGFLRELSLSGFNLSYLVPEKASSLVPPWELIVYWVIFSGVFTWLGFRYARPISQ
jgi:hypothetical protein